MTTLELEPISQAAHSGRNVSRLIDNIGRSKFEGELARSLGDICHPDHIHVFEIKSNVPRVISSISRDGSAAAAAMAEIYIVGGYRDNDPDFLDYCTRSYERPLLAKVDVIRPPSSMMAQYYRKVSVNERVMLWGETDRRILGVSLMRSERKGQPSPEWTTLVEHLTQVLFPIVARHVELDDMHSTIAASIRDVPQTEAMLRRIAPSLSARECQVLARAIHGIPAREVAAQLSIGEEAVVCYRKRAYAKTGTTRAQNLNMWYFDACLRLTLD